MEGFFLFAYNLELFGGKFHNKKTTVFSWGILPVFAGSAIQTNSISFEALIISVITSLLTLILISNSRPYKILKQTKGDIKEIKRREIILKLLTLVVVAGTGIFFVFKYFF